ncbi:type 2 lanthipeptide synthetase LanM family protein [Salipaludibacillus daqingensis]|uniref:type 2 lanthipeptide synthetase LanM family protein n=1 Tax=Salipaludibacillus daqingensis TaxID=3041001 RepID=UPI00247557B6|nr:type 2 lanthipeptide synthetase LanM family protein [Salipaludibacillus daqingensis]
MKSDLMNSFSQSAYLLERVEGRPAIDTSTKTTELDKWLNTVSEPMLEQRLINQGLSMESFKSRLQEPNQPALEKELEWINDFNNVLSYHSTKECDLNTTQALLSSFISYAEETLSRKLTHVPPDKIDTEALMIGIIDTLYQKLHNLCIKSVVLEINIARLTGQLEGETANARFQSFMKKFQQDPYEVVQFFSLYPVLGRLVTETTERYIRLLKELIDRFNTDYIELQSGFAEELSCLSALSFGLGDTHQDGREVIMLQFTSGAKLVYKPRSLKVDAQFSRLVGWLNRKGFKHPLAAVKVIEGGDYGWQEHVPYKECTTKEEVKRFYYRQGGFTALFYVLGSSDFHAENMIANGEYPIPVDLETLFSKNLEMTGHLSSKNELLLEMNRSVYSSLMITSPLLSEAAIDFDVSAIGAKAGQESKKLTALTVADAGTDQMRLVSEIVKSPDYKNRVKMKEETMNPIDYANDIEQGFKDLYKIIYENAAEFKSPEGPLSFFKGTKIRQVFRPTQVYSEFLANSLHPDYLQNGLERVRLFDYLWQMTTQSDKFQLFTSSETQQMLTHDVPYFYYYVDGRDIYDGNGNCIGEFFDRTSYGDVYDKLDRLSPADMEKQSQYVRWSLATLIENAWEHNQARPFIEKKQLDRPSDPSLFLSEALKIGSIIAQRAIAETEREEVNWIGLNLSGEKGLDVGIKGNDIYDGLAGYSLFFAYLSKLSSDSHYRLLSEKIAYFIAGKLKERPKLPTISVFSGEGAPVYTLVHLGLLWDDPELINRAEDHLETVDQVLSFEDHEPDFVSGLSGLVVCCLNAFEKTGRNKFKETAVRASILLAEKIERMTLTFENPGPGLAHGTAGYLWALSKSAVVTDDLTVARALTKLMTFEAGTIQEGTLPASYGGAKHDGGSRCFWCHGAPGIALATVMRNERTPGTEERMEKLLAAVSEEGLLSSHCLCHGTLGNIDIMLSAAKQLSEDRWYVKALRMGHDVLAEKESRGWRSGLHRYAEMDGFMLGQTGIGYGLMRLAAPWIPSVLSLEFPEPDQKRKRVSPYERH